jgi:hypothetical protein
MPTRHDAFPDTEQPLSGWWSRSFFLREAPYGLALARMYLPIVLLMDVLPRWPFVRELYSRDGAPAPLAENFGYPDWLPILPGSVAVGVYTALVFCLVTASLGWQTRISLLVCAFLYPYFTLLDCITTLTKYTVIASHVLLILSLSNVGSVWSIDAWVRGRREGHLPWSDVGREAVRSAVWPQRLIQLLVCAIYFGAGMTKLHTTAFLSGEQMMYWMMTYVNSPHPVGEYLTQFPLVLVVAAYSTLVWEVVFPFVIWRTRGKWCALAMGAMFHVMTALTLGLYIFPQVMLAAYLAFLTEEEVQAIARHARRWRRWAGSLARRQAAPVASWLAAAGRSTAARAGVASPFFARSGAFAMLLAVVSLGGIEAEHWLDVYGERGPGGPMTLRELSAERVERLMEPVQLRQADKFFSFDLGGRIIGDHLVNYRRAFRQGEMLHAQVCLNQPHEDMWLECQLNGVDGRLINRYGQVAAREAFRAHFRLPLDCSLPPGEYDLVLNNAGQEIMRRRFSVAESDGSHAESAPAAN